MEILHTLIDFILHIEVHLDVMIKTYQHWSYLLLFLVIFSETGLVIFPFLPGDSLLFAIGAFTARGSFEFFSIGLTLFIAALMGDTLNYSIGKYLGPRIFDREESLFLNKKHLLRARHFYQSYGAKTIILARFIPIIRTFAPFVAGIGEMTFERFMLFSVLGAFLWIFSFLPLGYYFGNLPVVQHNFKLVMLAIVLISVMPGLISYFRETKNNS